jgi:DNA topoisomerase-1
MKWKDLRSNGIAFPPGYESKQLSIRIRGKEVRLSTEAEELAYAWGKKRATPYVQDPVFQSNFLSDFAKLLPSEYRGIKYSEIDWTPVHEYQLREEQQKTDPVFKKKLAVQRKELRLKLKEQYGYAEIDGVRTEIANWMAEPPSLFMGRGSHPMRGRWKPRANPEDVVLNLSEEAPVPPGNWKAVVHDHDFMWIGYWVDKLSKVRKYVWPSDISNLRQERDKQKFELAKKLTRSLPNVRRHIDVGLASDDLRIRKLATVCYLIDNLAMRVGDEKDEDEADTVGASTLRVEHVKFHLNNVEFDFLGKDSVRWQKTLELHGPHNLVRKNLQEFCKNKKGEDLVFDGINSSSVNRFLGTAMKGLTAKVFRTHHATETVQKYLNQYDGFKPDSPPFMKLYRARLANLEAAIRCNHKRTPPKTWESSLEKKQLHLNDLQGKETKTEKQALRMKERVEKLKLDIDLQRRTRDYNLNTSLRGYIDPRVYRKWAGEDWTRIYPKTLQRKFLWATRSKS